MVGYRRKGTSRRVGPIDAQRSRAEPCSHRRGAGWQGGEGQHPLCPVCPQQILIVTFFKPFHTIDAVPPASTPKTPGFAVGNEEESEH